MDERTQRRVLWLVGGMLLCYVVSAACFALGFMARKGWLFAAAFLLLIAGSGLSTIIRPVALGFRGWWTDAPRGRRALNVGLMVVRVVVIAIFAVATIHLSVR